MKRRPIGAVAAIYLGSVVAVSLAIGRLGDANWLATAMMFAPRWVWGAPLLLLVPLAWRRDRRALVPLAAAAVVLVGPILDFRIPFRRLGRLGEPARDLRVLTYNIGGGRIDRAALAAMFAEVDPDFIAVQEREGGVVFGERNVKCQPSGQCLASRFPIQRVDIRDRNDFTAQHGSGAIVRYEVETPRGRVDITNVHLATVREGLAEVIRRGPGGAGALTEITRVRRLEAEAARAYALEGKGAVIVMGDFNTPVESAIYRATWGSFENAFSTAGLGFGVTKRTRWHGVRIDHVLAGRGLEVVRAWVGPGLGGDHRPVIADLRFVAQ